MATVPIHADGHWCPREQATGKCPKPHDYIDAEN